MGCLDENTVAELFDGVLAPSDRRRVETHLDSCAACRSLVGTLGAELSGGSWTTVPGVHGARPPRIDRGTTIGRLIVTAPLGAGSMGEVYAAYDPDLDRRVALKRLIASDDDPAVRRRLLDEARSMARLSDPHVVAIHDVIQTEHAAYIAMEYVAGQTLTRWLETERSATEILRVFRQAGEGLAAAHAVGIVHRDFKPDNVLVSDDGRARVTDFGLAARPPDLGMTEAETEGQARAQVHASMMVVGTPRYMAPEQYRGEPADPRSDQFSFCVALYRALYGHPPFEGDTVEALATAVIEGRLRPPPVSASISAAVRRVVIRGLDPDPSQRHAGMAELLLTLRSARRAGLRRALAFGAVVLTAAAVGLGASLPERADPCPRVGLDDVWNDRRAAALADALSPWPEHDEWRRRVSDELDAHAAQWVAMHEDACQATRVRRTQTEAVLERRMACLEQRRRELQALVDVLGGLSPAAGPNAMDAARRLRSLDDCADLEGLQRGSAPAPLPPTLIAALDRAKAMVDAGDFTRAEPMAHQARQLAEDGPARGRAAAALAMAWVRANTGQAREAEARLHEALVHAEEAGADDLRAEALALLTFVVGYASAQHEQGLAFGAQAHALATRIGASPVRQAQIWRYRGLVHHEQGAFEAAALAHQHAIELVTEAGRSRHPEHAKAIVDLANAHRALDRLDDAEAGYRHALQVERDALGLRHPRVANALHGLGDVLLEQRRPEPALALFEQALEIHRHAFGPAHLDVAGDRLAIAQAKLALDRPAQAEADLDAALAIYEAAPDPDHPRRAVALSELGQLRFAQGRHAESLAAQRASIEIRRRVTPRHPDLAIALFNAGIDLLQLQRPQDAQPYFHEAAQLAEQVLGEDHQLVVVSRVQYAKASLLLGHRQEAAQILDRVDAIGLERLKPGQQLEIRLTLAHALWMLGEDRAGALAVVREGMRAHEAFAGADDPGLVEARAWLAARE